MLPITNVSGAPMARILGRFLRRRPVWTRRVRSDGVPVDAARGDHRCSQGREDQDGSGQQRMILRAQQHVQQSVQRGKQGGESGTALEAAQRVLDWVNVW